MKHIWMISIGMILLSGCTLDTVPCHRKADMGNIQFDLDLPDDGYAYDNGSKCVQYTCEDGIWTKTPNHFCDYSCSVEKGRVECGECLNGTCSQDDSSICKKGKWVIAAKGECEACEDGSVSYINNENNICKKRECIAQNWVSVDFSCQTSCAGNECGDCINGSCNYDKDVKICKLGRWVDDDTGICGECLEGSCHETDEKICREKTWVAYEEGDKERCLSCEPGEEKTFTNEAGICENRTCIGGQWNINQDFCPNSCTADNKCGECMNDDIKYEEKDGICLEIICVDGKWQLQAEASDNKVSCNEEKSEPGVCFNGDITYRETASVCSMYKCQNGHWDEIEARNFSCLKDVSGNDTGFGECQNEDMHYIEDEYSRCQKQICHDGHWQNEGEPSVNSCMKGENDTLSGTGECLNGSTICENNTENLCINGQYVFSRECFSCENNICISAQCENDTCKTDSDSQIGMICQNNESTQCPAGYSCKSDKECGECINHSKKYSENNGLCSYQTCENGSLGNAIVCENDVSCKVSDGVFSSCGECKNGTVIYSENGGICSYKTCIDGVFSGDKACDNSVSCQKNGNKPTACGQCKSGTSSYSESSGICSYIQCVDGKKTTTTCKSGVRTVSCNASKTGCGECKNGNYFFNYSNKCYVRPCQNGTITGTPQKCSDYPCLTDSNGAPNGCIQCQTGDRACKNHLGYICVNYQWQSANVTC